MKKTVTRVIVMTESGRVILKLLKQICGRDWAGGGGGGGQKWRSRLQEPEEAISQVKWAILVAA